MSNRHKRRIQRCYSAMKPCSKTTDGRHVFGPWQTEVKTDNCSTADRMIGLAADKAKTFRSCVHCGKRVGVIQ